MVITDRQVRSPTFHPHPGSVPCALAIGGLDPGGGAGIAADLRAFAAAGVFGCAAIAVLTVQSAAGIRSARAISSADVLAQAQEVIAHQRVRSLKIGALGSYDNVRAVARLLTQHSNIPAVIDTPMLPTRGRSALLSSRAIGALRDELLPQAALATLNSVEAQAVSGVPVRTLNEAREVARRLASAGLRAVLLKGGHLRAPAAVDVLVIGEKVVELRAPRLRGGAVHGTGCTLASLIAGRLAHAGRHKPDAALLVATVRWAKRVHHAALAGAVRVGDGMRVMLLDHVV